MTSEMPWMARPVAEAAREPRSEVGTSAANAWANASPLGLLITGLVLCAISASRLACGFVFLSAASAIRARNSFAESGAEVAGEHVGNKFCSNYGSGTVFSTLAGCQAQMAICMWLCSDQQFRGVQSCDSEAISACGSFIEFSIKAVRQASQGLRWCVCESSVDPLGRTGHKGVMLTDEFCDACYSAPQLVAHRQSLLRNGSYFPWLLGILSALLVLLAFAPLFRRWPSFQETVYSFTGLASFVDLVVNLVALVSWSNSEVFKSLCFKGHAFDLRYKTEAVFPDSAYDDACAYSSGEHNMANTIFAIIVLDVLVLVAFAYLQTLREQGAISFVGRERRKLLSSLAARVLPVSFDSRRGATEDQPPAGAIGWARSRLGLSGSAASRRNASRSALGVDVSLGLGLDARQGDRRDYVESNGLLSGLRRGRRSRQEGGSIAQTDGLRTAGNLAENPGSPSIDLQFDWELEDGEIVESESEGDDDGVANARLLCSLRDEGQIDLDIACDDDDDLDSLFGTDVKSPSKRFALPTVPGTSVGLPNARLPAALPTVPGASTSSPCRLVAALPAVPAVGASLAPLATTDLELSFGDDSPEPAILGQLEPGLFIPRQPAKSLAQAGSTLAGRSLPPCPGGAVPVRRLPPSPDAAVAGRQLPPSPDQQLPDGDDACSDDSGLSELFAAR